MKPAGPISGLLRPLNEPLILSLGGLFSPTTPFAEPPLPLPVRSNVAFPPAPADMSARHPDISTPRQEPEPTPFLPPVDDGRMGRFLFHEPEGKIQYGWALGPSNPPAPVQDETWGGYEGDSVRLPPIRKKRAKQVEADPLRSLRVAALAHGRAAEKAHKELMDPKLSRRHVEMAIEKREKLWQKSLEEQIRHTHGAIRKGRAQGVAPFSQPRPPRSRPHRSGPRAQRALRNTASPPSAMPPVPIWMGRATTPPRDGLAAYRS